jgi:hypothetical protein
MGSNLGAINGHVKLGDGTRKVMAHHFNKVMALVGTYSK